MARLVRQVAARGVALNAERKSYSQETVTVGSIPATVFHIPPSAEAAEVEPLDPFGW